MHAFNFYWMELQRYVAERWMLMIYGEILYVEEFQYFEQHFVFSWSFYGLKFTKWDNQLR